MRDPRQLCDCGRQDCLRCRHRANIRRVRAIAREVRDMDRTATFCRENDGPDCTYKSTLDEGVLFGLGRRRRKRLA